MLSFLPFYYDVSKIAVQAQGPVFNERKIVSVQAYFWFILNRNSVGPAHRLHLVEINQEYARTLTILRPL